MRSFERSSQEARPLSFEKGFNRHAEGSCLVRWGTTIVLATATIEEKVPRWIEKKGAGWVTAEYSMLPRATHQRVERESIKGKPSGRTQEIQRLIGRSLRACMDLEKLGERTIIVDCDVLQADGGTRTASINGGFVALQMAVEKLLKEEKITQNPIKDTVSAVSLGINKGEILTDLDYQEDSTCDVDINVVMLGKDQMIEIQGTGEKTSFSISQTNDILLQAQKAIEKIRKIQLEAK